MYTDLLITHTMHEMSSVCTNLLHVILLCRGILPAFGHDRVASESEILGALAMARPGQPMHITHLFNVSTFHHRYTQYVRNMQCM